MFKLVAFPLFPLLITGLNPKLVATFYHGMDAVYDQFPYAVQYNKIVNESSEYSCAGALIDNQWVLLAADCLHKGEAEVVLDIYRNLPDGVGRRVRVEKSFPYEKYVSDKTSVNNIALIKVEYPLSDEDVIALPTLEQQYNKWEGETAWSGGWGRISNEPKYPVLVVMTYGKFTIQPSQECTKALYLPSIYNSMICVPGGESSPCIDDSGAFLAVKQNNIPLLIGVLTFGVPQDCERGLPIAYTPVGLFLPWIKNIMANN